MKKILYIFIINFSIFCYSLDYNHYDNNYFYQNNGLAILLISSKKEIDDKFITALKKTKKHFNKFFSTKEYIHINTQKTKELIKNRGIFLYDAFFKIYLKSNPYKKYYSKYLVAILSYNALLGINANKFHQLKQLHKKQQLPQFSNIFKISNPLLEKNFYHLYAETISFLYYLYSFIYNSKGKQFNHKHFQAFFLGKKQNWYENSLNQVYSHLSPLPSFIIKKNIEKNLINYDLNISPNKKQLIIKKLKQILLRSSSETFQAIQKTIVFIEKTKKQNFLQKIFNNKEKEWEQILNNLKKSLTTQISEESYLELWEKSYYPRLYKTPNYLKISRTKDKEQEIIDNTEQSFISILNNH